MWWRDTPSLLRRFVVLVWIFSPTTAAVSSYAADHEVILVDPSSPVDVVWAEKSFGPSTRYEAAVIDGRNAILADGEGSASGLYRDSRFSVRDYPILEWSWRVDRLPVDADIRTKAGDDVGASIFLIFGRPRLFGPQPPTLVYAWTSSATPKGSVVPSPYHAGNVRTIVLRSGTVELGGWVSERRDVVADFRRAFDTDPPARVETIALWSDSDQTGKRVRAMYGRTTARRK